MDPSPNVRDAINTLIEKWGGMLGVYNFRSTPTSSDQYWAHWVFPDGGYIAVDATNGFRPVASWFDSEGRLHREHMPAVITVTSLKYYDHGHAQGTLDHSLMVD